VDDTDSEALPKGGRSSTGEGEWMG
jgi:hypothetical protein